MSAIEFLMNGGAATTGGDLPDNERRLCDGFIKKFGDEVAKLRRSYQIPVSQLSIFNMNFLFIGKDISDYHFIFVDKAGFNEIRYKILSEDGEIPTDKLIKTIKMEFGEVRWATSIPIAVIANISNDKIENLANQYIKDIIETKKNSDNAITISEIAKESKIFKDDHNDKKTAFIIMRFSKTDAHKKIAQTIKNTLSKHDIVGLRADDKEYAIDLFTNIKTYMHCCDFGIGVFEKISNDNEKISNDNFNPNVSLEVGYMMGLGKSVCFLKDKTLEKLHTDLMGKLYKEFDSQKVEETLPDQIEKWMRDKRII